MAPILKTNFFLGAIKMQIRTKKSGKYKEDELDKGIEALEKKYTEHIEKKYDCVAAHLDAKIFKVRFGMNARRKAHGW